jgi:hypothetical protein
MESKIKPKGAGRNEYYKAFAHISSQFFVCFI